MVFTGHCRGITTIPQSRKNSEGGAGGRHAGGCKAPLPPEVGTEDPVFTVALIPQPEHCTGYRRQMIKSVL